MNGKNILITGASRGIGKAIKLTLQNEGYNCITPSRDELDVMELSTIEPYFSNLNHEIDGLVNNAGINILADIESINDQNIKAMTTANLIAPLKIIQCVARGMKNRGGGKIVNISSIWGVRSKEYRTLYSLTKFGLNGITKSLSREFGKDNILINSVAPGYVNTEMTKKNIPTHLRESIREDIPLGRFAEPEEISRLVAFLLSDNNTYITGQTLVIDGGVLA